MTQHALFGTGVQPGGARGSSEGPPPPAASAAPAGAATAPQESVAAEQPAAWSPRVSLYSWLAPREGLKAASAWWWHGVRLDQ